MVAQAKILNITLQTTKKEFVAFTEQQAKDFVVATVDFRDRMDANGPVKCTDLDVGLQLLVQFQVRVLSCFFIIPLFIKTYWFLQCHCNKNNINLVLSIVLAMKVINVDMPKIIILRRNPFHLDNMWCKFGNLFL